MVRVPPNGVEMAQWHAKQALDMGCYGIVFPHISTRGGGLQRGRRLPLPAPEDAPLYEPAGIRGDGPHGRARYWGVCAAGIL